MARAAQMKSSEELVDLIISMDEIICKLNSFFTDSVILKMNYEVEALGNEVESLIGFASAEITGHPFSRLCTDHRIQDIISQEIRRGYFDGVTTILLNRENEPVKVSMSGFYLGLISDINGYIILKVKVLEDNSFLKNELVIKNRELDSFIYRTAHDLRGPIATIKGLVNLLKMRQNDREVDELTSLIELHANKLDDRLFRLLYISNSDDEVECDGVLHFDDLRDVLRKTLQNNFQIDNTTFNYIAPTQALPNINESRLTHLLNNLLLYVVGLPIATVPAEGEVIISVAIEVSSNKLNVHVCAKGFLAGDNIRNAVNQPVSLYNDILNYPALFNYYVAQREVMHLNGVLSVDFSQNDEQLLQLTIPLNLPLAHDGNEINVSNEVRFNHNN